MSFQVTLFHYINPSLGQDAHAMMQCQSNPRGARYRSCLSDGLILDEDFSHPGFLLISSIPAAAA